MIPDKWTALNSSRGPNPDPLAKGAPRASPGQPCPCQGEGGLALCTNRFVGSHPAQGSGGLGGESLFVLR